MSKTASPLSVPCFKQREIKSCGPSALSMMFAFWGESISEEEITKSVGGLKKFGTRTIDLAKFASNRGWRVQCLTLNQKLAKRQAKFQRPSLNVLKRQLKNGAPVMVVVRTFLFYRRSKWTDEGHFVVVTGVSEGKVHVNDPFTGRKKKVREEEFLLSWSANAVNSSGYFLSILPKK